MAPYFKRLFQRSPMLKVLAGNIRDGEKLGLHPDDHLDAVARDVHLGLASRMDLDLVDAEDYLIEFEEVCFGRLPQRAGSAHLLRASAPLPDDLPEWYTCVITVSHWTKYLSTAAIDQLSEASGVPLPFVPMAGGADPALHRILTKLPHGEFAPKSDFSLGFPLVWFTPRPEFERRMRDSAGQADKARDFLGLIHREADEHLVAIHIPATAVQSVLSARPIFSDAGRHRRFMVMPDDEPPYSMAWGQTLDLAYFEEHQGRHSGAAERVCGRIDASKLGGSKIPYEYLGRTQSTRGKTTATDADFAASQEASDRIGYARIIERI